MFSSVNSEKIQKIGFSRIRVESWYCHFLIVNRLRNKSLVLRSGIIEFKSVIFFDYAFILSTRF